MYLIFFHFCFYRFHVKTNGKDRLEDWIGFQCRVQIFIKLLRRGFVVALVNTIPGQLHESLAYVM